MTRTRELDSFRNLFTITPPVGAQGRLAVGVSPDETLWVEQDLTYSPRGSLVLVAELLLDGEVIATSYETHVRPPRELAPDGCTGLLRFQFPSLALPPAHYGVRYRARFNDGPWQACDLHPGGVCV